MHDKVDAFDGREIHIWLATEEREDALMALAGSVPDVAAVQAAVQVPEGEAEARRPRRGRRRGRAGGTTRPRAPRRSASTPSAWTS